MEARRQVRTKLLEKGIPAVYVDQIADLGFHAADRAAATLQDIVFTAGDERISITALGVAISIAQVRLQTLQEAMIAAAEDSGLPVKQFSVGGLKNG